MAMYHPQRPDGDYEIANRVVTFEPPAAIEWEPGYYVEDGQRDSAAGPGATTSWRSMARSTSPSPTTGQRYARGT